jgi:hypothetical protein
VYEPEAREDGHSQDASGGRKKDEYTFFNKLLNLYLGNSYKQDKEIYRFLLCYLNSKADNLDLNKVIRHE